MKISFLIYMGLIALGTFACRPVAAQARNPCSDLRQPVNACVESWKCNAADHAWWPQTLSPAGTACTRIGGQMGVCPGGTPFEDALPVCFVAYTVGGRVTGISAGTVSLQLGNGGAALTIGNGAFTFPTPLANGSQYNVTVSTQPSGQVCVVSKGSGKINGGNVTSITVTCSAPKDIVACDDFGCISEATMLADICNVLANNVVGYVCIVGGLPPVYGGQARTGSDAPSAAMSPDLPTNIASVSKTITAIAVLQLLATNGLTVDSPISPNLYSDWTQGPGVDRITFRELLTHTSGFGQVGMCGNGTWTYSDVQSLVALGVTSSNIRVPQYGNCNFSLLRELVAVLSGQAAITSLPPASRGAASSAQYVKYLNSNVFSAVGLSSRACNPPAAGLEMLSYPFPAGTTPGTDWQNWSGYDSTTWALACGAAGWWLSANDIFKVVNSLASSNVLLSAMNYQDMYLNCLGWDCAVGRLCPNPYVCKNGSFGMDAQSRDIWTYAGIVNCKVPVVVVVNSPMPTAWNGSPDNDIIGLVAQAYGQAAIPGAPTTCH
jgi:Beta-lactamase